MRPRSLLLVPALVLAALSGCSRSATAPASGGGGPVAPSAPALVESSPAAFAPRHVYDAPIWARFDRPLDARTVSGASVFLKLDGQRIPCTVTYEDSSRRIFVRPTVTLQLQRTYTVDFTPAVHAADGTPLPERVFLQFTTNSLRHLTYDFPLAGAIEGPLPAFGWAGTQGATNNLIYELYAGTDSAAVANRTVPYVQRWVFTRVLTPVAWPRGARVWWSVTTENLTTREREDGPMRSFQVVDASLPEQTVTLSIQDWGSNNSQIRGGAQYCNSSSLPCGPAHNASMHFNYTNLGARARITGATLRLVLQPTYANTWDSRRPTLWMTQNDWSACAVGIPGPPYNEPSSRVSQSVATSSNQIEFRDESFAAFLEAQYRARSFLYGVVVRANDNCWFYSPLEVNGALTPVLTVRFVRLPAEPQP